MNDVLVLNRIFTVDNGSDKVWICLVAPFYTAYNILWIIC